MRFLDWTVDMHIVTKRFLLRDFVDDDGPAFLAYHADPVLMNFMDRKKPSPAILDTSWNFLSCGLPNVHGAITSWPLFNAWSLTHSSAVAACALQIPSVGGSSWALNWRLIIGVATVMPSR